MGQLKAASNASRLSFVVCRTMLPQTNDELKAKNNALEAEVQTLKAKNNALEAEVQTLKKEMKRKTILESRKKHMKVKRSWDKGNAMQLMRHVQRTGKLPR